MIDKVAAKTQNWKGSLLFLGGRLTLLNYVLTAVPLYRISLYKVPVKVRKSVDSAGCKFLWQGTSSKKKYALISWKWVCMPKTLGDMGVLDLHCMNSALLLKWWWKLKDPQYHSIWKQIVCAKYQSSTPRSKLSPLWRDIMDLQPISLVGCAAVVGNGKDTSFWHDRFLGECSLASSYHHSFQICSTTTISVHDVVVSTGHALQFIRLLTGV